MKQKNHKGGYLSVLMCLLSAIFVFSVAEAGTLSRVDKLTAEEKTQITAAEKKCADAQKELADLKAKIATAHDMKAQSWMEWSSWVEFDGDYVLYHFKSHMGNLDAFIR